MKRNKCDIVPLGALLEDTPRNGYSPVCPELPTGKWVLGLSALDGRGLDLSEPKPAPANDPLVDKFMLRPGDFLISRSNTFEKVGRVGVFRGGLENCSYPDLMMRFRPDSSKVHPLYLETYLKCDAAIKFIRQHATGTSGSMKKINQATVESIPVVVPSLERQKKIAELLLDWFGAIQKTEQLIAAKERHRDALIQRLYLRSDSCGRPSRFGDLLAESMEVGHNGLHAKKITVRLYGKGVFSKEEKRLGSERTQYFVRRTGQLIYSKLDFLNGAFGIIPPELDGYESTLDLPAFDIAPTVNPVWLLGYLTRPIYYTRQVGLARGQRKARRVHPSDLLASGLKVPPRDLQNRIAEILTSSQCDIDQSKRLLEALKTQKRGLMQKLLTGQWRLPVSAPQPEHGNL
jgi:type I restriction enzyme S subunit